MPRITLRAYAHAYLQATASPQEAVAAFDACADAIRTIPGLRGFISNNAIATDSRRKALDIAAPKQGKEAYNLILLLARDKRLRELDTLGTVLREEAAKSKEQSHAVVTSAVPLPDKTLKRLTDILTKRFKHDIWLESHVDPSIIAGLRIQMGDWVFDATRRGRLTRLEHSLIN